MSEIAQLAKGQICIDDESLRLSDFGFDIFPSFLLDNRGALSNEAVQPSGLNLNPDGTLTLSYDHFSQINASIFSVGESNLVEEIYSSHFISSLTKIGYVLWRSFKHALDRIRFVFLGEALRAPLKEASRGMEIAGTLWRVEQALPKHFLSSQEWTILFRRMMCFEMGCLA